MLTLFEVASLELYLDVMYACMDITGQWTAPVRHSNDGAALFFIFFILFCVLFLLNLFVSLVLDNFNQAKADGDGDVFMTAGQKKWADSLSAASKVRISWDLAEPPKQQVRERGGSGRGGRGGKREEGRRGLWCVCHGVCYGVCYGECRSVKLCVVFIVLTLSPLLSLSLFLPPLPLHSGASVRSIS